MSDKICPLTEIPIKGGATLKINGGFKLECLGDSCQIYSDACYEDVYETLERMIVEIDGKKFIKWEDVQHFFDVWSECG
jgi:hypothetical protein